MGNEPERAATVEELTWPDRASRSIWVRLGVAPASVGLALALKLLLASLLGHDAPFQLFLAAVVASAWVGGWAAGLGATLLAALLADLLFLAPFGQVLAGDWTTRMALIFFVIEGGVISYFGGALDAAARRSARQAVLTARQAAEIAVRQQVEANLNERLRIETALRTSEARYRTLVEHLPNIVVFLYDHDLRYLLVDGPALKRHGFVKADMEGRTLWEMLPPERAAALAPAYQAALRGETVTLTHERDGYTYSSHFVAVYAANGEVIGGMAVIEDTTERTRVERALRANEQRFQAFMNHSPTLVWMTDAAGQLHFANATLRRGSTMQPERAEEMRIGDLFPASIAAAHLANIREVAESGQALEAIEVAPRTDGTLGEYLVYKFPIDTEEGRLVGGVAVDITTERRAAAQLRASLEEKEVLLREIHHRVKNNLQLIISLLRLQATTYSDPALQTMLREGQQRIRAIALVHEKLYQSNNLARVDIASYIRALSGYLARSYSSGQIQVVTELEELDFSIDQAVPCGLIIHELVSNAFKHAFQPGGAGQITITLHQSGGQIELGVADDGIGLPEGLPARAETSLGMQLVRTFVEQLHGVLRLLPGLGTRVQIVFPLQQPSWR